MLLVRKAVEQDFNAVKDVYTHARGFMEAKGNPEQWAGGYPTDEIIKDDIKSGSLYLVTDSTGGLMGVFFFSTEPEPLYEQILDGEWLMPDKRYGVIHRVAISESSHGKGIGAFIFSYCFGMISNLRIDTYKDNLPMQHTLERCGFVRRGIVLLPNGSPRIAYQRVG